MKNIEIIKSKYFNLFVKRFSQKTNKKIDEKNKYICSILAEIWAYIFTVIPEDYGRLDIFDFDGSIKKKKAEGVEFINVMDSHTTLQAKNEICKYCWGVNWEFIQKEFIKDKENIKKFLRAQNIMHKRFQRGDNVVIHGSSQGPVGRTMLASIIMKEAIKLRVFPKTRFQTYDWIDFSTLFEASEKDLLDLVDYRTCDWLVVDNILKKPRSVKQDTFISDSIDPFFLERFNNRLPTILVFKFDVTKDPALLERTFGIGVGKIIENKRTTIISLTGQS